MTGADRCMRAYVLGLLAKPRGAHWSPTSFVLEAVQRAARRAGDVAYLTSRPTRSLRRVETEAVGAENRRIRKTPGGLDTDGGIGKGHMVSLGCISSSGRCVLVLCILQCLHLTLTASRCRRRLDREGPS